MRMKRLDAEGWITLRSVIGLATGEPTTRSVVRGSRGYRDDAVGYAEFDCHGIAHVEARHPRGWRSPFDSAPVAADLAMTTQP